MTTVVLPGQPPAETDPDPALSLASGAAPNADRPPVCPVCQRRFVILASRFRSVASSVTIRLQLWGCPRGHATADYAAGAFEPIEILPAV